MFPVRRAEVVAVAARLFGERGYDSTSISEICEAADIGKGALYHYINSKEELLAAIFESYLVPTLAEVKQAVAIPGTALERLERMSRVLVHAIAEHGYEVRVVEREWALIRSGGSLWRPVTKQMRAFDDLLLKILRDGAETGEISFDEPALAVMAFWGMHNYISRWYHGGRFTEDQIANAFCRIFAHGVAGPGSRG
jgi:TetR/AcrR family transcriptional regulator, cholesterol catabolism regulator